MADEKKTAESTAVAVVQSALPVLASFEKNRQQVQEFLDDGGLVYNDLPQIKVPARDAKNWEMPDGSGQPTFEAVIIAQQQTRSYWKRDAEDNAPPDCSSADAVTGFGDNGTKGAHDCGTCPWAQFGTAVDDKGRTGAGQACKLVTQMVLLTEKAGRLPAILQLPPTSAKAARAFRNKIFAKDKMRHQVVATFGVENQKGGAFPYNTVTIDIARELDETDVARVEGVSAMLLPAIARMFAGRVQQDAGATGPTNTPLNVIDEEA